MGMEKPVPTRVIATETVSYCDTYTLGGKLIIIDDPATEAIGLDSDTCREQGDNPVEMLYKVEGKNCVVRIIALESP